MVLQPKIDPGKSKGWVSFEHFSERYASWLQANTCTCLIEQSFKISWNCGTLWKNNSATTTSVRPFWLQSLMCAPQKLQIIMQAASLDSLPSNRPQREEEANFTPGHAKAQPGTPVHFDHQKSHSLYGYVKWLNGIRGARVCQSSRVSSSDEYDLWKEPGGVSIPSKHLWRIFKSAQLCPT